MRVTKIFKFLFEQELGDLRKSDVKYFRNIQVDESNILLWQGLIVPVSIAYWHIKCYKKVVDLFMYSNHIMNDNTCNVALFIVHISYVICPVLRLLK